MTSDQPTSTPSIRGEERLALVEDLALAKQTHAELAAKYGRSHQAVKQFSARNAAEIAIRRQVLLGEVDAEGAHLWVSDKVTRRAWRQKLIEDLEIRLADEGLDPRLRSRYTRDIDMLLHRVAEEKGELPTRITVELTEVPVLSHIIEGFDRDKW